MTLTAETVPGPTLTIQPGPRNAYTDPDSGLRFYRWQGRDLVSVTSARRMAGIPHGLHQWTLGKVIDRALDDLPALLERVRSGDPRELAAVRTFLRRAATDERDRAAELGTAVHDAAAEGRALPDVDPAVRPRLRQYLDWRAKSQAEILASEFQVFHLGAGYAGSADLLARFPDGSIDVVDLKTGKGIYPDHALQVMAYLMAEFVGADDVVNEEVTALLHQATGAAVLHLADDGWEYHRLRVDAATWNAYRGLLAFALWSHLHTRVSDIAIASRKGGTR